MPASPSIPTPQTRTRVRDNQRRSRARKKEYIHQLEAQVRAAEQRRVLATVEVQTAARRVVEENRRLRELLRYHGGVSPSGRSCACTSGPKLDVKNGKNNNDNNNCSMAADLISTMTGANPHDVRTSLGCTPGTECHVDDARIGDAIEHLTSPGE
ncbi:uncharacterized protein C8A04DRAFT_34717 [Dichotomopilus funicola]|uniref:BZIP domain-containing protein n=1 Tax=Dichotomopilus funicola TaxID=1934379 RepID=A0AAN6V9E5_9PEZI|nr:hypothetical protein C8A04DRAFT_34717 [Dichotomopilus funicola]